ncbi:unnamed protein product [Caenorhabditis brenneri]
MDNTPADMRLDLPGNCKHDFKYDKPLTQKSIKSNLEDYPEDPALWERDKLLDIHRDDGMIATLALDNKVLKFRVWIPDKDRSPYQQH